MANRFWVGGSGTWDNSATTHWSTTSGGASGSAAPTSADIVTFDGASGAGAVITVNANVTASSVNLGVGGGNFTGTLDFATNNNSPTFGTFAFTGSGTRTLNLGNGTWTITGTGSVWNMLTTTGLTFNANSSTLNFTMNTLTARTFTGGGLTYNNVNVAANPSGGNFQFSTASTISTENITAPNEILYTSGTTHTIGTLNVNGTSIAQIMMRGSTDGTAGTISIASNAPSINWSGIRDITCTGGATFAALNSFDLGHNSGITITPPNPPVGQFISAQRGTPY